MVYVNRHHFIYIYATISNNWHQLTIFVSHLPSQSSSISASPLAHWGEHINFFISHKSSIRSIASTKSLETTSLITKQKLSVNAHRKRLHRALYSRYLWAACCKHKNNTQSTLYQIRFYLFVFCRSQHKPFKTRTTTSTPHTALRN